MSNNIDPDAYSIDHYHGLPVTFYGIVTSFWCSSKLRIRSERAPLPYPWNFAIKQTTQKQQLRNRGLNGDIKPEQKEPEHRQQKSGANILKKYWERSRHSVWQSEAWSFRLLCRATQDHILYSPKVNAPFMKRTASSEENAFENAPNVKMLRMRRFRSSCEIAKYHLGLCSPFIHSVVSNDSDSGQWRPWSVCANVQADQGLRCPQMPEKQFSHGAAKRISSSTSQKNWSVY